MHKYRKNSGVLDLLWYMFSKGGMIRNLFLAANKACNDGYPPVDLSVSAPSEGLAKVSGVPAMTSRTFRGSWR